MSSVNNMCNNNKTCLFVFVLLTIWCGLLQHGICQSEGDVCQISTGTGICKPIIECPQALDELKKGIRPEICGFRGKVSEVCCQSAVSTPRSSPPPNYLDYESLELFPRAECPPIPRKAARVLKTGQKAWDKCISYLQYVYPCELAETLSARKDMARRYQCGHEDTQFFEGTGDVADGEIPHMAVLGYGPSVDWATWACAGTIISKRYILTAASCIAKGSDMVSFVRVGRVSISSAIDQSRLYNVSKFISNPQYNRQLHHNDIGLVKTTAPITFDHRVYPACLHTGNLVDDGKMMSTGWGFTNSNGSPSRSLAKVTLDKLGWEDCSGDRLRRSPKSQICAGYPADANETCQVDAGSPLQILNPDVDCMYTVLGVASVGPKCGVGTEHGIFTRVSTFTQWIERVVWS